MSDGERRGRSLLLGGLLLLSLVLAGPTIASTGGSGQSAGDQAASFAEARAEGRAHVVAPHPNSSAAIWPYTSRSRSVEGATLPINIVVLADVDVVRSMLIHRPDAQWEDQREGLNGTAGGENVSDVGEGNASEGGGALVPGATATPSTSGSEGDFATNGTSTQNSIEGVPTATFDGTAVPTTANGTPVENGGTPYHGGTPVENGSTLVANETTSPPGTSDGAATRTTSGTSPAPNGTTTATDYGGEGPLILSGLNSTGVYWSDATGANRYTYVTNGEPAEGQWIAEADQLHDGDYFGTRYHIRFYRVPDGENSWSALQVHREHFDWFRLRHTVGSLPTAQHYVETQFYNRWYVADLQKHRFAGGGILNYNGWATVVDLRISEDLGGSLSAAALVFGVVAIGSVGRLGSTIDRDAIEGAVEQVPINPRTLVASLAVAAVPLLVRVGAIAVEHTRWINSPDVVAGAFFPIVALGPPILAYVLFRGVDPGEAFVAAFVALGVGFLADYAYLGIRVLPIELIVHRAVLLVAVGVVAVAGAVRPDERPLRDPALLTGAFLWVVGLLWALFLW